MELKATKYQHASNVEIKDISDDPVFSLQDLTNIFKKSLKHLGKQPQRLCTTKCGRPTLPSSTRSARPPAPTALQSPNLQLTPRLMLEFASRLSVLKVQNQRLRPSYPELSRSCAGHLRTVPNGSERFRGTSERFRTVQRPPLSVHEWFACSSGRVPRVVFGAVVQKRFRPAPSTDGESWIDAIRSQLPTFLLLTHLT